MPKILPIKKKTQNIHSDESKNLILLNDTNSIDIKKFQIKNIFKIKYMIIIYIIAFFLFLQIFLFFLKIYIKARKERKLINKYYDMLPKTSLDDNKKIKSLKDIFNSRQLYINDSNLTTEYIHYIRPINETEEQEYQKVIYNKVIPNDFSDEKRIGQYSFTEYYDICQEEKLINGNFEKSDKPLISVIVSSFNKEKKILPSIRSIQNQSLKNIEIIIVDDCSTDDSESKYKYLLETDPRIRVFSHLKNLGLWRVRLNGFLYSRAKYILHFDMEDFLIDNYILEDSYNLVKNYSLDSVRFSFIKYNKKGFPQLNKAFKMNFSNKLQKINYGKLNINLFSVHYGSIWNRLTRANILSNGYFLLNSYTLNAYKNLWEDRWLNFLINKLSFSYLMINRVGYLYLPTPEGIGKIKIKNKEEKNKTIREFILFWIFDLQFLPKDSKKKNVIQNLRKFHNANNRYFDSYINLNFLIYKYQPYEYLLNTLIEDPYVLEIDKIFLKHLLDDYMERTRYSEQKDYLIK